MSDANKKTRRSGSFCHQYHPNILSVVIPTMVIIRDFRSASYAVVDGFRLLLRSQSVYGSFTQARVNLSLISGTLGQTRSTPRLRICSSEIRISLGRAFKFEVLARTASSPFNSIARGRSKKCDGCRWLYHGRHVFDDEGMTQLDKECPTFTRPVVSFDHTYPEDETP